MSIILHHLNSSRSESLFWVLEELGLTYDVKVHWRTKEGRGPATLKEVSRYGKAPILVVDGMTRTESGAIVNFLLSNHTHPGIEHKASEDSVFWSHFAEGSLMLHLQAVFTASKVAQGFASYKVLYLLAFFLRGVNSFNDILQGIGKDSIVPMLAEVEEFLEKNENFSGNSELGEGDFMMFFPLNSITTGSRKGMYEVGPRTAAWVQNVKQRPAWQKARQRLEEEEKAQAQARL